MCDNAAASTKLRGTGIGTARASSSPALVSAVACVTRPASSGKGADCARYVAVGTRRSVALCTRITPCALRIIMISAVRTHPASWFHCGLLHPAPSHLVFAWGIRLSTVLFPHLAESLDYTAHEADLDDTYVEQDDYTVEKILAQRPNASVAGGVKFRVRWRGYGPSHDTWEPVSSFAPRINTPFMKFVRTHKIQLQVSDLEALTRAIEASGN